MRRESEDKIKFEFEQTFMFYLPRICEHCLNPSCVASCPSGAIYKRSEDGIVLVDQDRCRGWRQCVTGCPYKKIYFNHKTGKAEKCTFCYPRVEVGLPDGLLGDLRRPAALPRAVPLRRRRGHRRRVGRRTTQDLYEAQLDLLLDPNDPAVIAAAAQQGIPEDWIDAARRSPVYALAKTYRVALPLHPEYRTMPMVWYVPPLSPVVDLLIATRATTREDRGDLFGAIEALRIPVEYLAELFTAGDTEIVDRRAAASSPRCAPTCATSPWAASRTSRSRPSVGMTGGGCTRCTGCWRSPSTRSATSSRRRTPSRPTTWRSSAARSTSTAARACTESGPFGEASGRPVPVAVETFHALQANGRPPTAATPARVSCAAGSTCSTGTARAPRRHVPRHEARTADAA